MATETNPQDEILNTLSSIPAALAGHEHWKSLSGPLLEEAKAKLQANPMGSPDDDKDLSERVKANYIQSKVPPMTPEQWSALKARSEETALQHVTQSDHPVLQGAMASDPTFSDKAKAIGSQFFEDHFAPLAKYVVQQPKGQEQPQTQAPSQEPSVSEAPPLVAPHKPKTLPPSEGQAGNFARSLIDMVRGAGQVAEKQKAGAPEMPQEKFKKVLRGR